MPDRPALRVEQVHLSLGGHAILNGVSLTGRAGETTAVLGPNGAGKTTLIRCCTGLLRPDSGRIDVLGHAPGSRAAADRVGLMPQATGAWSGARPRELLAYLASLYAQPLALDDLIGELGIGPFQDTPYRRLSGGQQHLVNLAGAIVGRPHLLFLDEPTAGLDPHVRRVVWALIGRLRSAGVGIVLSTHAMDEAENLADQVFLMDAGRIVLSGTVRELTAGGSLEEVYLAHTTPEAAR